MIINECKEIKRLFQRWNFHEDSITAKSDDDYKKFAASRLGSVCCGRLRARFDPCAQTEGLGYYNFRAPGGSEEAFQADSRYGDGTWNGYRASLKRRL